MNKNEKLFDALGGVDDRYIVSAYKREKEKKSLSGIFEIIGTVAAVAAVAVFAVVLSHFAGKTDNITGGEAAGYLYSEDFHDYGLQQLHFLTDDGSLEYDISLIVSKKEAFFFNCTVKVTNRTGSTIRMQREEKLNSYFTLTNRLTSTKDNQLMKYAGRVYYGDTLTLKPDESHEESLYCTTGVYETLTNAYVNYPLVSYIDVTVNLGPSHTRDWGKGFYWFYNSYYNNVTGDIEVPVLSADDVNKTTKIKVDLGGGAYRVFTGDAARQLASFFAPLHSNGMNNTGNSSGYTVRFYKDDMLGKYGDGAYKVLYLSDWVREDDGFTFYKLDRDVQNEFVTLIDTLDCDFYRLLELIYTSNIKNVTNIEITSMTEGIEYTLEGADAREFAEYLNQIHVYYPTPSSVTDLTAQYVIKVSYDDMEDTVMYFSKYAGGCCIRSKKILYNPLQLKEDGYNEFVKTLHDIIKKSE